MTDWNHNMDEAPRDGTVFLAQSEKGRLTNGLNWLVWHNGRFHITGIGDHVLRPVVRRVVAWTDISPPESE